MLHEQHFLTELGNIQERLALLWNRLMWNGPVPFNLPGSNKGKKESEEYLVGEVIYGFYGARMIAQSLCIEALPVMPKYVKSIARKREFFLARCAWKDAAPMV